MRNLKKSLIINELKKSLRIREQAKLIRLDERIGVVEDTITHFEVSTPHALPEIANLNLGRLTKNLSQVRTQRLSKTPGLLPPHNIGKRPFPNASLPKNIYLIMSQMTISSSWARLEWWVSSTKSTFKDSPFKLLMVPHNIVGTIWLKVQGK